MDTHKPMRFNWEPNRSDHKGTFTLHAELPQNYRWEEQFGLVAYSSAEEFSRRWPYKEDIKSIQDQGREIVILACAEYPVSGKDMGRHRTHSDYFKNKFIVCSRPVQSEEDLTQLSAPTEK